MRTPSTALAIVALLAAAGCEGTTQTPDLAIDTSVALEAAEAVLMVASLGVEIGHVFDAPDFTFGACPTLDEQGDELILDYGAGCAPGSGTTAEDLSGLVTLISPATNSISSGSSPGFGFADLPLAGDFTLATHRTGDTVKVDLELLSLTWTASGRDRSLDGLFTLLLGPDSATISLSRGNLGRDTTDVIALEASEITVAMGGLGSCPLPSAGRIDLDLGTETASVEFVATTPDAGAFNVTLDDGTVGDAVLDCQPAAR